MVRNIVVLGGSSHPSLTESICDQLGLPPGNGKPICLLFNLYGRADVAAVLLSKFSVGETRVEINESVRVRNTPKGFDRIYTLRSRNVHLGYKGPLAVETRL